MADHLSDESPADCHDDAAEEIASSSPSHLVVLDLDPGRRWLTGTISSDEYFHDAIEAAGEEARDEVRELIRSAF